jgi:fido (protein-threonine AMPylation protein)
VPRHLLIEGAAAGPGGPAWPTRPWAPIADLPADWAALARPDLRRLAAEWRARLERIAPAKRRRRLVARLHLGWALDAWAEDILGYYAPAAGAADALAARAEVEAANLYAALTRQQALSLAFLRELHRRLTRPEAAAAAPPHGTWAEWHEWKRVPNFPTRPGPPPPGAPPLAAFCPPERVEAELGRLLALQAAHARRGVPPEVAAAWLHHRFVLIHPFLGGNGRVARALASWALLRGGGFPLVLPRAERAAYLRALEAADAGELGPLVGLLGAAQAAALQEALALLDGLEGG